MKTYAYLRLTSLSLLLSPLRFLSLFWDSYEQTEKINFKINLHDKTIYKTLFFRCIWFEKQMNNGTNNYTNLIVYIYKYIMAICK